MIYAECHAELLYITAWLNKQGKEDIISSLAWKCAGVACCEGIEIVKEPTWGHCWDICSNLGCAKLGKAAQATRTKRDNNSPTPQINNFHITG